VSAIARLQGALNDFAIGGVRTNLPLLLWIVRDEAFRAGDTTTSFLAQRLNESTFARSGAPDGAGLLAAAALLADGRAPWRIGDVGIPLRLQSGDTVVAVTANAGDQPGAWRITGDRNGNLRARRAGDTVAAEFDGEAIAGRVWYTGAGVDVLVDGRTWTFAPAASPAVDAHGSGAAGATGGSVTAPMPGKIVKVAVREGDSVGERELLIVLEAMKMEHRIEASADATVRSVLVKEGQIVAAGTALVELG
jgi:acetyl/propionyl-CoA carboxylase alpha subunit